MAGIGAIGAGSGLDFGTIGKLVDSVGGGGDVGGSGGVGAGDGAGAGGGIDFAAVLKDKLGGLEAQQVDSAKASEEMATGRVGDVAQTMLRIEQANVSLQMATQVRNKVIESYQEIMRMQM